MNISRLCKRLLPAHAFGISHFTNQRKYHMLILFIISIAVFFYMAYVLIKPEKF
jgi:hypothetical protein